MEAKKSFPQDTMDKAQNHRNYASYSSIIPSSESYSLQKYDHSSSKSPEDGCESSWKVHFVNITQRPKKNTGMAKKPLKKTFPIFKKHLL